MIRWLAFVVSCLGTLAPAAALAFEPRVAVHVSEATAARWTYSSWKSFHPAQFLEEAFISDGTPFVEVTDAAIDGGILLEANGSPRYPIVFSLANEVISDARATAFRNYVSAGGHVYVGSSSWTRHTNGTLRRDASGKPVFALGGELGLVPGSWMQMSSVFKAQDDAMINHLPAGLSEWQMPRRYTYLDLWTPHWAWAAAPAPSASATTLLSHQMNAKFAPSFDSPPVVSNPQTTTFLYADVNGDKQTDMVLRQSGSIAVRLSNSQGLQSAVTWSTWSTSFTADLADVNGDGMADLVGRSGNNVEVGLSTGQSFAASSQWTTWNTAYSMTFADADGDGDADIVGRNSAGDVQVGRSRGVGGGTGFAASTSWTNWIPSVSMAFADVDGDGDADIAGRSSVGDLFVGLSTGKVGGSSFAQATLWTNWITAYGMDFADVDGDGDADVVGRLVNGNDVQVGLSNGKAGNPNFAQATQWSTWASDFNMSLADINGDRRFDLVGCKISSGGTGFPLGDVHVGLSGGAAASMQVKLGFKLFGGGRFIYNSEIVPLAGYGGFSNDNSEYKTIRVSIIRAFEAARQPLIALAPWPFPKQAAMIFRHDHALAADIHQLEVSQGGASPTNRFGEYYQMPELASTPFHCNQVNDYPEQVPSVLNSGGLIGAHIIGHTQLDDLSYSGARGEIASTVDQIQTDTGSAMAPIFVAPVYRAIKQSSLRAIRDEGMLTTGEQGTGPYPHFSMDPETKGAYVGAVLQLPVSEWPKYDNMERMSVEPTAINRATALAYEMRGLLNVYDHVGADAYDAPCVPNMRLELARRYLDDALARQGLWVTNSLDIRNWWLQRDTRIITPSITQQGTSTVINVGIATRAPRASTDFSTTGLGLRITLDSFNVARRNSRITLTVDGVVQPGTSCSSITRVRCFGADLHVQIIDASQISVRLGS